MNDKSTEFGIFAEPLQLRSELRVHVLADPNRNSARLIDDLSSFLNREWRESLERRSITKEQLRAICYGYQREIWLWMVGNRTWDQMITGLAGRLERSAEAA